VAVLITVSIGILSLILHYYEKLRPEASVKPKKESREKEIKTEEKDILYEETLHVSPVYGCYYDFELNRGEHLKGEIISDSAIDIYFVDSINFKKWDKDGSFNYEDCTESVFETKIDYVAPRKGTWHVIIDCSGRKSAKVKVCLY